MFISQHKKFIFIHVQRTAGTSLRRFLAGHIPDFQSFLGTHDHARLAKENLGADWEQYWTSAFVRNPWERLVSWYSTITQHSPAPPWDALLPERRPNQMWQYVWCNATTFDEFLYRCTQPIDDTDGRKSFVYNQLDYVADAWGNLLVDFVGRYEHLRADLAVVCHRLSLDPSTFTHLNASQHPHYSTFYSPATRELVRERYARDIEFFGYTFDEQPLNSRNHESASHG